MNTKDDSGFGRLGISRRQFLGGSVLLATLGSSSLWIPASSASAPEPQPSRATLDGSIDPFPLPWLDKNGSHNQSPGSQMDPSNIYHFKGRVARANNFTGMGTDNKGNRISFGTPSTDFSFLDGEYFAGRVPRLGTFTHI